MCFDLKTFQWGINSALGGCLSSEHLCCCVIAQDAFLGEFQVYYNALHSSGMCCQRDCDLWTEAIMFVIQFEKKTSLQVMMLRSPVQISTPRYI